MRKKKPVECEPRISPIPAVNRTTVGKLIDVHGGGNLTEAGFLMLRGLSSPAAKLESTMTQEGHPAFPYRLEVVARLAATLVKEGDFNQAAKDAVALLNACKAELSKITEDEALRVIEEEKNRRPPPNMNFAACAQYVTGESQDYRAQPLFRRFQTQFAPTMELPEEIPGIMAYEWRRGFDVWHQKYKSEAAREKGKLGGRPKKKT